MKSMDNYISEKLHLRKGSVVPYTCAPKDKYELIKIIVDRVKKNGVRKMFNGDLNDIDVSGIEDMSGLIGLGWKEHEIKLDRRIGNIDISKWNVSNVTTMQSMFFGCKSFNCNLENWDVSNLENATAMFAGCESLDFDISKWDPVKLKETDKTWKMIVNTNLEHQDWMR